MAKKKEDPGDAALMLQFDVMKQKHPDAILLFRRGDFYETYKQDAIKAGVTLGITTASRKIDGNEIKVAGFPHHALDTYLPKLVRAGMRVAICEQLEKPQRKKTEKEKSQTTRRRNRPRRKSLSRP